MPKLTEEGRKIDPILCLSVSSPALSLCFVSDPSTTKSNVCDSETSEDSGNESSDSDLDFRSARLRTNNAAQSSSAVLDPRLLSDRFLFTGHRSGEALLWDLGRQKVAARLDCENRQGPCLAARQIHGSHDILFQTRDPRGVVSIQSFAEVGGGCATVVEYETHSQTFCQATPCIGDSHLVALPSRSDSTVTVMDIRDPSPIYVNPIPNHGMLTSLAMAVCGGTGKPILACGMESGTVVFHDFAATTSPSSGNHNNKLNLSKDPILCIDLAPSEPNQPKNDEPMSSVVVLAGMAGDAAEVSELPSSEQGRLALFKAVSPFHRSGSKDWEFRMRARLSTCRIDDAKSYGKPGVSICRFRPGDHRLFALGGWDHRVRVFERSNGRPLAILRGHHGSVGGLDWAADSLTSGLLATTGSADNQVYLWRCFSKE